MTTVFVGGYGDPWGSGTTKVGSQGKGLVLVEQNGIH